MAENGGREPNGHEENGHEENGGTSQRALDDYRGLGGIGILSFAASPPRVVPFERTTLSWSVTIPAGMRDVSLTLAGQTTPGPVGSAIDNPYVTTTYGLDAETPFANREVGRLTVTVDDSACATQFLSATNFADGIRNQITQAFRKNSDFANVKVTVTAGDNIIVINVPYSGTDITVQLGIGIQGVPPQAAVAISLDSVDVERNVSTTDDILSLGLASDISDLVKQIIKVFVGLIAEALIVPGIAEQLDALVQSDASIDKQFDQQKRTFVLTDLTLTGEFLMPKLCPLPAPPPQQAIDPVEAG